MKHTMKKLLCMALAIMLLVSAVPVFAMAANPNTNWVDIVYAVDGSGNATGYVRSYLNDDGKVLAAKYQEAAAAVNAQDAAFDHWEYNGSRITLSDFNFSAITSPVNVYAVYKETEYVTVTVDYGDNRTYTYEVEVGAPLGARVLPANPTRTGRRFLYWYCGSTTYNAGNVADSSYDGLTFTAAWETVGCTECGEEVGHKTTCSQYEGNGSSQPDQPSGSTTAAYVSVILSTKTSGFVAGDYINCNLVNGKIAATDRNTVAAAISSKGLNIIGWKRADNGTQASSLVDFDFAGLAEPINILPIFGASNTGSGNTGNSGSTGSSGYDYGTNGRTVHFLCAGQVVYSKVVHNDAELAVAKSEAQAKITALGCYKFNGWK